MTRPGKGGNDNHRLVCEGCGTEWDDRTTVAVMSLHTELEHPEWGKQPHLLILEPDESWQEAKDRVVNETPPPRWQRRARAKKGRH